MNTQNQRRVRDGLMGMLFALAAFGYQQFLLGRVYVAGAAGVGVIAVFAIYRYADHQLASAIAEHGDAEDLKPLLKRLGRAIRNRIEKRRDS